MNKKALLATGLVLALALSGCGGGSEKASGLKAGVVEKASNAANSITFTAQNWKFDKKVYEVKAGEPVTLELKNKEGYHGLEVVGTGLKLVMDKPQTVVFKKPGTYVIHCNIMCGSEHSQMQSKLIVQ
jgi:heme/copper-type cytochrome/quinol oxidase subunit 2